MTERFTGKAAIITGGAKGIGKATTLQFLREGGTAVAVDLEERQGDWAKALFEAAGDLAARLHYIQADCTDEAVVQKAVADSIGIVSRVDILVNNIGFGTSVVPLDEMDIEFWQRSYSVNMLSCFLMTRAVLAHMRKHGDGRIVNVSSITGRTFSEVSSSAYHSAKAAMLGFTRKLAYEEGLNGIRVNAIAPGTTFTERVEKRFGELGSERRDQVIAAYPLRRAARPEEIAGPILFLASDDASYVNGAVLDVNGGRFMG